MTTLIALLRSINIGGNNLLPMQELSALLMSMGSASHLPDPGSHSLQYPYCSYPFFSTFQWRSMIRSGGLNPPHPVLSFNEGDDHEHSRHDDSCAA